ncbi:MAG: DAK2 domain-containing protein [Anaerolineae bacterium]
MTELLAAQGFKFKNNMLVACNGIGLKNLLSAGRDWLAAHVNHVNGLNVFPVPDGDTGTNMLLTLRSAVEALEEAPDHNVDTIARVAARGALLGARGNSGVILSQFLHGLAEGLAGNTVYTAAGFAGAARRATDVAYQSVLEPVEGTILTVARAIAEAASLSAARSEDLAEQLAEVVAAARVAQASTPELLPVLKEAGVTDSGGQGLLYFLEGWLRFLQAKAVDADPAGDSVPALRSEFGADHADYGYDVQFIIRGEGLDVPQIRTQVGAMGDSVVVVGDAQTAKVHVHTDDPGRPISFGAGLGVLSDVVVENLTRQAHSFVQTHAAQVSVAVVAVSPGAGLSDIFAGLGVNRVVAGGQSMNPSVQDLLHAIEQTRAENVLILPNNSNIMLTAQHAAKIAAPNVLVVPTDTVPQGIAAMVAFNPQAAVAESAARMAAAARQVTTIELTRAVRDTVANGISVSGGALIALVDNQLACTGETVEDAALAALARVDAAQAEILTIYFGDAETAEQAMAMARAIRAAHPQLDVEIYRGNQPHYPYLISLE